VRRATLKGERKVRTISKKTKYGLQALIALTRKFGEGPVLIATLAGEEDIPLKFLELILLDLKNSGIVDSKKGRGGGYLLSRDPSKITIGSVIRAMEGPLAPLPCASETAYRPCEECKNVEQCGTRIVMREVRDAMAEILDRTTLHDVLEKVDSVKARKPPGDIMYYI
jgi:Rrf2 family protein